MAALAIQSVKNSQSAYLSVNSHNGNANIELKTDSFRVTGWPVEAFLNCTGTFWFLQIGRFEFGAVTQTMAETIVTYLKKELAEVGIEWNAGV